MATAKTGSFYLTETVTLAITAVSGDRVQGTVDLSAYVNVPTGQAIAIDEVDFVFQTGSSYKSTLNGMLTANGSLGAQLTDLNPGTAFVRADNQSLVASGTMNIDDANNIGTYVSDLYPDNFGPGGLSDMFICVNDQLYLVGGVDNADVNGSHIDITCRIRCRVVKLSTKDWMAVAIQSTASDN
jgi:hypothetical protein